MLTTVTLPKCGISLYESKHSKGDRIQPHYHHVHQILYVLSGQGEVKLDDQSHTLAPDHAVFVTPKTKHAIETENRLTILVLAFDDRALHSPDIDLLLTEYMPHSALFKADQTLGLENRQSLRKMLFEQSRQAPLYDISLRLHLLDILLNFSRLSSSPTAQDANTMRAEQIRQYIESNYFTAMTSSDIASRLKMSTRYVNELFKETYQVTPIQYLAATRIEEAKKLLTSTDKDITSICFEVGFETLSSFYRTFKQLVGRTPKQYRREG